jgi:biopolymer transport protein ExbB/TolQ
METTLPAHAPGFSLVKLIAGADPAVQAVILGLAILSVVCWAIFFEKLIAFTLFSRQVRRLEHFIEGKQSAEPAFSPLSSRFMALAVAEPRSAGQPIPEFQANLERSLRGESAAQLRRQRFGLPLLATVGSTAPFIGLLGTVWGIMNSFTGIAAAKDTSLAIVAPGIAEALLATAIGLAAAIPAVVFYNLASVFLGGQSERLFLAAARFAKDYAHRVTSPTSKQAKTG